MSVTTKPTTPSPVRDIHLMASPALWPTWPFLPVVRVTAGGETECGLLYDCWHVARRPGYSATVFLCNLFALPRTEPEFLAAPKRVYDTAAELLDDGWRVD